MWSNGWRAPSSFEQDGAHQARPVLGPAVQGAWPQGLSLWSGISARKAETVAKTLTVAAAHRLPSWRRGREGGDARQ